MGLPKKITRQFLVLLMSLEDVAGFVHRLSNKSRLSRAHGALDELK